MRWAEREKMPLSIYKLMIGKTRASGVIYLIPLDTKLNILSLDATLTAIWHISDLNLSCGSNLMSEWKISLFQPAMQLQLKYWCALPALKRPFHPICNQQPSICIQMRPVNESTRYLFKTLFTSCY